MTYQAKFLKFFPGVRERAVRMVAEHRSEHASEWAAIGKYPVSTAGAAAFRRRS